MYSIDNIDRDFEIMKRIIESVLYRPAKGMEELKDRYIQAKEHLFPFFNENGMRVEVMEGEGIGVDELNQIIEKANIKLNDYLTDNQIVFKHFNYRNLITGINEFCYHFSEDLIAGKILREVCIYGNRFAQDARIGKAMNAWLIGRMANHAFDNYKKFNTESDNRTLTEIGNLAISWIRDALQTSASKIYISINPLDYLMMSDHSSFTSCHSFLKQGCYHAGTISYMIDDTTLVGYASNTDKAIGHTYRNMADHGDVLMPYKNWRQLVHLDLSHKSAIFGREFADHNASYAKYLRKITGHFLQEYSGDIAEKWKMSSNGYSFSQGTQEEKDDDIERNSRFYHAAGESWEYDDGYRSIITLKSGSSPSICVGSESIVCPICGEERWPDDMERSDTLLCPSCGDRVCDNCGCIVSEDYCHSVDDLRLCEDCYYETYTQCYECGNDIRREDAEYYCYDPYCSECFEQYFAICADCGDTIRKGDSYILNGEILCEYCAAKWIEEEGEEEGAEASGS